MPLADGFGEGVVTASPDPIRTGARAGPVGRPQVVPTGPAGGCSVVTVTVNPFP